MSVAKVISFNERQAIGRPRRAPQTPAPCVILQFPSLAHRALMPIAGVDDDAFPGRGRDPG
jgi:hypothetical protein